MHPARFRVDAAVKGMPRGLGGHRTGQYRPQGLRAAAAAETLRDEPHLAAAAARARRTDLTAADRVWTADLTAAGWDADSL